MCSSDLIDDGLVRRATAPPPLAEIHSYFNTETGRMVQWGSRTYYYLIREAGYEIIEDYYLVPPRFVTVAQKDPSLLYWQDNQYRLELLEQALERHRYKIELEAVCQFRVHNLEWEIEATRQFFEQRQREADNLQEAQLRRLTELNIALCKECQMPVSLNELPESGLCEDCSKENV